MDEKYRNIAIFRKRILAWYRAEGRMFPWREQARSDYEKIVAEVLLQRTKAETVAKHYGDFLQTFPDWKHLADAPEEHIEQALKPLGLYKQRAGVFKCLSQAIMQMEGNTPSKRAHIDKLPGVGQYIANAVELICHGKRRPLIDVNMARVLERVFRPRKLVDIRYDPYLQELSKKVVNSPYAREINFAILDFAAKVCKSKNPRCEICPFTRYCSWYNQASATAASLGGVTENVV